MALVAASPAGALAAEEESGGAPTPGETATESPSAPAEPAASSPGSTGWTPVGPGAGTPSNGASPIRRGSSLGSGAGSNSNNSGDSEPVKSTGEEPSYTAGSAGYDEPESSTPSTFEEAASAGQAESTARPAAPPAPIAKAANVDLSTATPLALPQSPQGGNEGSASPPPPAALTNSTEQGGSDPNALLLLAVVVLGLGLAYAGWRVGLDLWDRRTQRQHLEVRRIREADWEAFLHRIERTQALDTPNPSGEQLHRAELGSESTPLKVGTNGSASQDPARGTPVKAG
ncbi:MAG: hypothetical protein WBL45_10590 [Solirubrobacterales bacterium]